MMYAGRGDMRRTFCVIVLSLLFLFSLTGSFKVPLVKSDPSAITVPDDYPTIQEAINHANDGDTVFVRNGTYYENVVVNKTVSLWGENKETTIIDGNETGDCVHVAAGGVRISGFTVRNGGDAYSSVRLSSDGNSITDSLLVDSWCGVSIDDYCGSNLIANNTMANNLNGVLGELWHDSQIIGNNITNNEMGIWIGPYSEHNTVSFNNIEGQWAEGIYTYSPSYSVFEGNNITNNNRGDFWAGLTVALQTPFSAGNKFFHNNIANHGRQIDVEGIQEFEPIVWDDGYPSGGNYWSDYNGTDADNDGIGDTPYVIGADDTDHYPLMDPWVPPDVAVTDLVASKTVVGQGYAVTVNVTFENQRSKIEVFNVVVYANAIIIHSEPIMLAMANQTLSFRWDSTGFGYGNYTLSAYAEPLPEETDIADNTYVFTIPVHVGVPGDVSGTVQGRYDGTVDMRDFSYMIVLFNSKPVSPNWNPNADVNGDGTVNLRDVMAGIVNFNRHE